MGISLGLDYSWFVIFVLLTWSLAGSYYPAEFKNWPSALYWLMGVVTALLFFVSILLHELGHSIVAAKTPEHPFIPMATGGCDCFSAPACWRVSSPMSRLVQTHTIPCFQRPGPLVMYAV